jgi:hypothetical protein
VTQEEEQDSPVEPAVFDLVHRYAEALREGARDEYLTTSTVIVQFCLAFFQRPTTGGCEARGTTTRRLT